MKLSFPTRATNGIGCLIGPRPSPLWQKRFLVWSGAGVVKYLAIKAFSHQDLLLCFSQRALENDPSRFSALYLGCTEAMHISQGSEHNAGIPSQQALVRKGLKVADTDRLDTEEHDSCSSLEKNSSTTCLTSGDFVTGSTSQNLSGLCTTSSLSTRKERSSCEKNQQHCVLYAELLWTSWFLFRVAQKYLR